MKLFNLFRRQLSSVIQWKDQNPELLWYKFPSEEDEIKNSSKLIIAPGQGCVLVYEGKISEILDKDGIYNLKTDNHPFITTLVNLRKSFESEHKLHIYFFRKAQILNQGWGTPSPLKYIDAIYNIPVELGLNGNFSYQIISINDLFINVIGSKNHYTADDLRTVLSERFPQQITSLIASEKYSFQEIDSQLNTISQKLFSILKKDFSSLGLELTDFRINGSQFDSETQKRIARIADITTDVQAAQEAGLSYSELEKLRALRDAAKNEGGVAGAGIQLGVGMELGKKFSDQTDELISKNSDGVAEKLRKLKILLDENIITLADYEEKKKELLNNL